MGRLWLLFLSRRGNLVQLLHLFLSKETRKPLCISIFRLPNVCFLLGSSKFVINFIIQRCLEAHWNPAMPAKSILTPLVYAMVPLLVQCKIPRLPLSLSLVTATAVHCCFREPWLSPWVMGYVGMGASLQLFL